MSYTQLTQEQRYQIGVVENRTFTNKNSKRGWCA